MRLINIAEISDTSRLMIGRAGAIGFGILPFFLFSVLESSVLFFVTWLLLSTLPFIVLMWRIFPYLSALEQSDTANLFVLGPPMLFLSIQIVATLLEMHLPFPVVMTLFLEWVVNCILVVGAYLMLVPHSLLK